MGTKKYKLTINKDNEIIIITGVTENAISIDYSGDIDFTNLVSELTSFMDSKVLLSPNENNDTCDEGSLKIILETIEKIIDEFNSTISDLVEEEAQGESIEITDSSEDTVDDLF